MTDSVKKFWPGSSRIYFWLFLLAALGSLYFRFKGWSGSLIELHSFRQTQTAITVQYLLKGGDFLRYQTPVLGPPWSIPMEFPFFQHLGYFVVKYTGYGIDQTGRLISLLFFASLLYPFYMLSRPYFADSNRTFIALALLCVSPQYTYWSRTFMIESTALALCLWYLYFVSRYLESKTTHGARSFILLGAVLFSGVVASMTKVTTFFVYYVIALLVLLVWTLRVAKLDVKTLLKEKGVFLLASVVLPLVAIAAWTYYSDQVKMLNPLGADLTSHHLSTWNFGSLEQKFNLNTWTTILERTVDDLFGEVWVFLAVLVLLPCCRKRTVLISLLLFGLFLLPIAIFTNLYFVHDYYSFANGILLILLASLILGDISLRGTWGLLASVALIVTIGATSGIEYVENFLPQQGNRFRYQEMKEQVARYTKPEDVLVIFSSSWSSEIPYYIERRALMVTDYPDEDTQRSMANLAQYRVGGVAFCGPSRAYPAALKVKIANELRFSGEGIQITGEKCDILFNGK